MGQHRFLGQFQNRNRVLARDGGEVLEEMIERIAFLEVVEKARTGKYRHIIRKCKGSSELYQAVSSIL